MNILVTGGAGFIGSHLIDTLLSAGHFVVCVDDLSAGSEAHVRHHRGNQRFVFAPLNILDRSSFEALFIAHAFDHVFHMAANSDILRGGADRTLDLDNTFMTTLATMECMERHGVRNMVFASSSAIYGEHSRPLHEDTGPLFPISFYGAAKLCSEAYIAAFCNMCRMRAWIFRFPNVVGERATHGVLFDFIRKLRTNPQELLILGDGHQEKPYLYVRDLIDGIMCGWQRAQDTINYFNLGVESTVRVTRIAEIVAEEMGLTDVRFIYTGGTQGWLGDVPKFQYDLSKIAALGWRAHTSSDAAVRCAVRAMLDAGDT